MSQTIFNLENFIETQVDIENEFSLKDFMEINKIRRVEIKIKT